MPIRDIIVVGAVLYLLPRILQKPWIGILAWSWIAYMAPHRLCWSFAYNLPIAQLVALALFAGMLMTREKLRLPSQPLLVVWIAFVLWMVIAAVAALNPSAATYELERALKIQLITFFTLMLITDKRRIIALVWVIVLSIGFYGVKGGVFSIRTSMNFIVWGPPGTFIEGNNELGLGLLMILPLFRFLQLQLTNKWHKRAISLAMVLCLFSVISTYSRGAFLAMAMCLFFLAMKSRQRVPMLALMIAATPVVLLLLPQEWYDRMSTIQTYQSDQSAMGRLNAWYFAMNIARANPLTGGGYGVFNPYNFLTYAPNPLSFHDAHSIYFEVLGEMGYGGLFLFLLLFTWSYFLAGRSAKRARNHEELGWAVDLLSMLQVSLVAYATGGAFLGLAYFDLPYHLIALIILTRVEIDKYLRRQQASAPPQGALKSDFPPLMTPQHEREAWSGGNHPRPPP